MTTENKYLVKVCALLRPPMPPRSEKAYKRPKKIHKPRLMKFINNIRAHEYK